MNYLINEAQFTLPDAEVQDTSINILKFAKLGTTLVVSRSPLADGESLQSNFEGQLKKLEQQVKDLRYSPAQAVKVGPTQDIDAFEVQNRFNKGSDKGTSPGAQGVQSTIKSAVESKFPGKPGAGQ